MMKIEYGLVNSFDYMLADAPLSNHFDIDLGKREKTYSNPIVRSP